MNAKSKFLFLALILLAIALTNSYAYSQVVAPVPTGSADKWWERVDEIQSLVVRWIGAFTVIAGALVGFAAFILSKVKELKKELRVVQGEVTDIATQAQAQVVRSDDAAARADVQATRADGMQVQLDNQKHSGPDAHVR